MIWSYTKSIAAYLSLLLNLSLTGSWVFISLASLNFEEASKRFDEIWIIDDVLLVIIAIIAGIFSIIYFSRSNGITTKIFLVIQVLVLIWFCWSLL